MKAAVLVKFFGKGSLAAARNFAHEAEHARQSVIPAGSCACVHPAESHPMDIGNGCAGVLITLTGEEAKDCASRYAIYIGGPDENKVPARVHTMTWFLHGAKFPGVRIGDVSLHDCVDHGAGEHPEAQPVVSTRSNPSEAKKRSVIVRSDKVLFATNGLEITAFYGNYLESRRFCDVIDMWMGGATVNNIISYAEKLGIKLETDNLH